MSDELERINKQIDSKVDESLDATRRILATAQETEQVGVETSKKLAEQGEKLDRIEARQDNIKSSVARNKEKLSAIEMCCGVFRRKKKLSENDRQREEEEQTAANKQSIVKETNSNKVNANAPTTTQGGGNNDMAKHGNFKRIINDAREDEMEANLNQVSDIVGNLKNLAIGLGGELDKQNEQIDRINTRVDDNATEIDALDERTTKLLLGSNKNKSSDINPTKLAAKAVLK